MSGRIENSSAERQCRGFWAIGPSLRNEVQFQLTRLGIFADQALDEGTQMGDQQQHLQSFA